MKKAIETRELFVLDDTGGPILGTYHKLSSDNHGLCPNRMGEARVGIVFLNGLSSTRAGHGDAVAYWADSFAKLGYPSFRLDLPGYGDSPGDPPDNWLDFIDSGGDAYIAAVKIREVVARFNLSAVVIMGQCAGAVTAIYTSAAIRECRGLVLMEPFFQLPHLARSRIRQQLNAWSFENRLGAFLSRTFDLLKQVRLFFRGNSPPENANFPLLLCWKDVASKGLPILILKAPARKAPGVKSRIGEFDYLKHILKLAGRKSQVVVKLVDDANHSFANQTGRLAVRQLTEEWLKEYFPPLEHYDLATNLSLDGSSIKCQDNSQKRPARTTLTVESENQ